MRKNIQIKSRKLIGLLFILTTLLSSLEVWADGSKDLYPSGKEGRRAYLRSHTSNNSQNSWPFANHGVHYVYAKVGETITLASSAQSRGDSRIRLYAPNGNQVVNNTSDGQISNRTAELAGPRLLGQGQGGNRYQPIYHTVTVEGIYRVEFVGPSTSDPSVSVNANANWTQSNNNSAIMAWDVSVINTDNTAFIPGRVYTNVLNLSNGTSNPNTTGFYGILYVLTKDGYTYRVDNNGNNGMYFTFFVNNNGFIDPDTQSPTYRSVDGSSDNALAGRVHNPNEADTPQHITHKMFYTLPANDMPQSATGAVPGGSTWLKNPVTEPDVSGVRLVGVEGTPGQVGNKGGYVEFDADTQGNYTIVIESTDVPEAFEKRVLTGSAIQGLNRIPWDGKDGQGNMLPPGTAPAKITVQLQGAEVHFPFIDMEYNTKGFILELLDHNNLNNVASDIIYWNDTNISFTPGGNRGTAPNPINNSHLPPANSEGISSNTNGHIWGVGGSGTSNQFGDQKSIDTWTFIKGEAVTITTDVAIKIADLEVTEIIPDNTTVSQGGDITFTVKVSNNGPSSVEGAPFGFVVPQGFNPGSVTPVFSGDGCGAESTAITYDAIERKYVSELDLPNGCEITYTITITVGYGTGTGNSYQFDATILRPNDVTDPDATNPDPDTPPTDPYFECANNGLGVDCNNINAVSVEIAAVDICTEEVDGDEFEWHYGNGEASGTVSETFTQPAANYGFVLDIFELDNSFNMEINGVQLAVQEIEFQSSGTSGINVAFADGDEYEDDTPDIWQMDGDATNPVIRVVISPSGAISLYGSKESYGPLYPLVLTNGNTFNSITWNAEGGNTILATQNVVGVTLMRGRGYGLNVIPCNYEFTVEKDGDFNDENSNGLAQPGETITYEFKVTNIGNAPVANVELNDPLLGGVITAVPTGDTNNNGILDISEEWVYTVSYPVTQTDIFTNKGVYNRATVTGDDQMGDGLPSVESIDPTPYQPGDEGYDSDRPYHTFVPLKGNSALITNPMVRQRVK